MRSIYPIKAVGDVLTLEYGKPLPEADRTSDNGVPAYGANGVLCWSRKAFRTKPSIIVGRKGSAGEINLTEGSFWPTDVTYFVEHDERVSDLRYLFYALKLLNLQKLAKGVKPGINRNDVYALKIPMPPLPEQQHIVAILDAVMEMVSNAESNLEKCVANLEALGLAAVDKAVSGTLVQHRRREGRASEMDALLSKSLRERGLIAEALKKPRIAHTITLPELPEGWIWASPEQLARYIVDCPHTTPKWTNEGAICLRTSNFKPGRLDLSSIRFVSEDTYKDRIARLEPQPGDVLYSREGSILGIACVLPCGTRACLGQRMMLFRLDTGLILPDYFASVLNSSFMLREVRFLTSGAASPHLNIRDIRAFPIPLPPLSEQQAIIQRLAEVSDALERQLSTFDRKSECLAELQSALMAEAFAGELIRAKDLAA